MNIVRMVVYGIVLLAGLIWLSSKVEAVPSGQLCQSTADSVWSQWGKGILPKTDETINTMMKFKQDCPQQGGSMQKIADAIMGQREKEKKAFRHIHFSSQDEHLEDLEIQR